MKSDRILVALIVSVVVVAVAVGAVKWSRLPRADSDRDPRPSVSLLVVGVEGLDLSIVRELSAEGKLPNLTRLMEEGAVGEFRNLGVDVDPRISWTSIVTGVSPEKQGIGGTIGVHRGKPLDAPLTPEYRTVDTIWTLLSNAGSSVGVIGWPATWPVEKIRGVMVAPYETYCLERKYGGDPAQLVYPLEEHDTLDALILERTAYARRDLSRFVSADSRLGLEALIGRAYEDLGAAVAGDVSLTTIARRVVSDPGAENLVVFLRGVEVVSQRFWHYMHPDEIRWEDTPEYTSKLLRDQVEALGVTIPCYYEFLDELVGRLERTVRDDGTVVVVSDHGYSGLRYTPRGAPRLWSQMHADTGFWIMRGPRVAAGAVADEGGLLDVAPTIMASSSIPLPGGLDGKAHEEVLRP